MLVKVHYCLYSGTLSNPEHSSSHLHTVWPSDWFQYYPVIYDRLCGLVVRDPGYRSRGPDSIHGAIKFSEKYIVFLERGLLSLVSTIEKLLGRRSSGSGQENREYDRREPSRWPRGTLYPQKFELTSPTNGGRSVGVVLSLTQVTGHLVFPPIIYSYFRSALRAGRLRGQSSSSSRVKYFHFSMSSKPALGSTQNPIQ
jgi:hypothetical protein